MSTEIALLFLSHFIIHRLQLFSSDLLFCFFNSDNLRFQIVPLLIHTFSYCYVSDSLMLSCLTCVHSSHNVYSKSNFPKKLVYIRANVLFMNYSETDYTHCLFTVCLQQFSHNMFVVYLNYNYHKISCHKGYNTPCQWSLLPC